MAPLPVPLQFQDRPLRLVKTTPKGVDGPSTPLNLIPVPDIAAAIGTPGRDLNRLINRNRDLFEEEAYLVVIPTTGGPQKTLCLTAEGGVIAILARAHARIKDPATRARLIAFKRWVAKVVIAILRGEFVPADVADLAYLPELRGGRARGEAVARLAARYGVVPETVYKWARRARQRAGLPAWHPDIGSRANRRALTIEQERAVIEYAQSHPRVPHSQILTALGLRCCVATIGNTLLRAGLRRNRPGRRRLQFEIDPGAA